jgi:hypothetical protein
MTLYEFLLFVHIAATVVWVGAGLCSLVLAIGYDRDGDERRFGVSWPIRSASRRGCSSRHR